MTDTRSQNGNKTPRRALLVYPINADFADIKGILRKMEYQAEAFRELGLDTSVACSSDRGLLVDGTLVARHPSASRRASPFNHHMAFWWELSRALSPEQFDFYYVRYPLATPPFLWFLRRTKQASPAPRIVLEIPTYPYRNELKTPRQLALRTSDDLLSSLLRRYVDLAVTFFGQSTIFAIPCIATGNGISVRGLPQRAARCLPESAPIRLIGVAALARWHGYDRLIRGIEAFAAAGNSGVTLDIVGSGPELSRLRALVDGSPAGCCVRFLGTLSGAKLDRCFDESDAAIGSLAMHRLALPLASSLKTREYCARGVPFVLAGNDPDFPSSSRLWHYVPEDESNIDIASIVRFVRSTRRDPLISTQMRAYAEANLTWAKKLEPVLARLRA